MKLELNKIYKTKNGHSVKMIMKTDWGFFGQLQDNARINVKYKEDGTVPDRGSKGSLLDIEKKIKYDENGKVTGWTFGNVNDIKGLEETEPEPEKKKTTYREKYEAIQKAKEEKQKESLDEKAKEVADGGQLGES